MLTGVPLAFVFWYKRLYNAAATDRALSYLGFFLLFGVHTGFCIWAAIGMAQLARVSQHLPLRLVVGLHVCASRHRTQIIHAIVHRAALHGGPMMNN
jgi:hypothetical protein